MRGAVRLMRMASLGDAGLGELVGGLSSLPPSEPVVERRFAISVAVNIGSVESLLRDLWI